MGMFDNIKVNYPLPDADLWKVALRTQKWQTKSLECQMYTYVITAEGRLLLINSHRTAEGTNIDMQMHGNIVFYDMLGTVNTPSEMWLEYTATFDNGQLTEIKSNHKTHEQLQKERDSTRDMMQKVMAKHERKKRV